MAAEASAVRAIELSMRFGAGPGAIQALDPVSGRDSARRGDGPGPLLIARDLPLRRIRALRADGAEAWPGPWSATHLSIEEV